MNDIVARLVVLGIVLAAAVGLVWRWHAGAIDDAVDACEQRHKAALADHLQRAAEQAAGIARQDAEVATAALAAEQRIQIKYRTVVEEVVKNVPLDSSCLINPFGFGLLNRALTNGRGHATPADPAKPDGKVPGPDDLARPGDAKGGGEARGGIRPLLPMPGPAWSFI